MAEWVYRAVKRAVDIVVAGTALLALLPVLLVTLWLVRRQMGSPVLFRHTRAGQHGVPFDVLKIRTMRPPRPDEHMYSSDGDRLTPLGARLRSWSLDELPQLINVLKGEMTLVGPRPLPMEYLRRYTPEQRQRLRARPGITGLAQVSGRNDIAWGQRLALDVEYVEQASLTHDLVILRRTVSLVLRRSGVSAAGHATMPELPRARRSGSQATRPEIDQLLSRPASAVWRRVGPAVVVAVDDDSDPQLLAGVGARLWDLLEQPRTRAELMSIGPDVDGALRDMGTAGVLVAA